MQLDLLVTPSNVVHCDPGIAYRQSRIDMGMDIHGYLRVSIEHVDMDGYG